MKKLFISCPMNGLNDGAIEKIREQMHKIAELIFGQELEVIDSFFKEDINNDDNVIKNYPVYYLGESLKMLSKADYFIGIDYLAGHKGCEIENMVARSYGIPSYYIDSGADFISNAMIYDYCEQDVEITKQAYEIISQAGVSAEEGVSVENV